MEEKAKKRMVLKEDACETRGANTSRMAPGLGARLGWGQHFERAGVAACVPHVGGSWWVQSHPQPRAGCSRCSQVREGTGTRRVCSTQVQARARTRRGRGHALRDPGTRAPSQPVGKGRAQHQAHRHPQPHKPHQPLFTQQRMFRLFYGGG